MKDASLRVALLTPSYWPEVRRGSERIVHDLGVALRAGGHRPRVLTSHPGRPARSVEDGVPVLRSWRPPDGLLRARGFQEQVTHLPFSAAALAAGEDDLAHAFYPTDAVVAARWARRGERAAVFSFMGVPLREGVASRRGRMRALCGAVLGADAVVVLSAAARDAAWRWLGVEARVIHPGVDLEAFRPAPERRASAPTFVCAASPEEPRKRVELLARAFRRVRAERPAARLVLMRPGDPALGARLLEAAGPGAELRDVTSAVSDLLREAWVSVLPARHEAFGLVLAEALACGTPAVGTAEGGIPDIVDRPEVGRVFAPDDEDGLVRALLEALALAEDPATPAACRARAEAFGVERMGAEHVALYRELLGRG